MVRAAYSGPSFATDAPVQRDAPANSSVSLTRSEAIDVLRAADVIVLELKGTSTSPQVVNFVQAVRQVYEATDGDDPSVDVRVEMVDGHRIVHLSLARRERAVS